MNENYQAVKTENGASVNGAPLTTAITDTVAPGLLRNAIDERIVKIRPMATPIDQLSRCAGARQCGSMKVDYYSVDVKPVSAKVSTALKADAYNEQNGALTIVVKTDNDAIFSPTETVLIPTVYPDGKESSGPLTLYVVSVDTAGVKMMPVGVTEEESGLSCGAIAAGTEIVRMGRAACELDVQTAQFEALPVKRNNYCQIFKMQVEQSTFQKLANKEVGWNFSDQEEVAIIDMRQGMEKNFLFGRKAVLTDPVKGDEVYLTGGIWHQTGKEFKYNPATLDTGVLVELCRMAFTGNGGNSRKILVGGSGLIEALSKISYDKNVDAGGTFVKWGIEFKEIRTNFGSLYVLHSEIFDQCGHSDDGFVLDPDCLTKYCHVPFQTETLNLRSSGQRNTDAIVITEASCLVLRHPDSHVRVVAEKTAAKSAKA